MKKALAALASVVIALAVGLVPAVAASAAQPDGGPVPCNQIGYTKFDSGSGNQTLTSGAATVGNLTWSGPSLTYTLQPGWKVDLCIKSGSQVGTVEYPAVSGTGTLTIAQDISHIGWKNPVRTTLTPGYSSTDETCVSDQLVGGSVSVVLATGIAYALAGPGGAVALTAGTSGPIPSGTYALTAADGDANDGYTVTPLSTSVVIAAFDGECGSTPEPVVVTPNATVSAQTCVAGYLKGGQITVDLSVPGVTYSIEGGSIQFDGSGVTGPLGPGSYTVTATDSDPSDGYVLAASFEKELVVDAYGHACYPPKKTYVTPAVSSVDERCYAETVLSGRITVDLTVPGVTYLIDGGAVPFDGTGTTGPLAAGSYTVTAVDSDPNDAYVLATPFERVIEIAAADGQCGYPDPEIVTPVADASDEICEAGELIGGHITVDLTVPGITYLIDGGAVPFDGAGTTAALAPGFYTVTATDNDPDDGYALAAPFEQILQIAPSGDLDCVDLPDHPLVTPTASSLAGACDLNGSFTIGNSEGPGAVSWTANGDPIEEGTHVVSGAASIHLVATANGPDFGFAEGTQTEWTFDFLAATGCDELETLALTGADRSDALGALALLTLITGTLLVSAARLRRSRVTP